MAPTRNRKTSKAQHFEDSPAETEIPEEEQWRLINESGILKKVKIDMAPHVDDEDGMSPLAVEIFDAIIIIIPISFLLLLMEVLIHFQYGKHPSWDTLVDRMVSGVPIIAIFVFFTTRHSLWE
ncbi:hypothetical protein H0H81_007899 [Sphagnurus paluster]|uniref:Uncharacterized protein n=1 Tax=Sphagnurus paluster TaxID=117069 RepID=A0A9P7FXH4_9AGAR|nr:hypothetical protein H0H81_007899 [Sphagnurus paluster]